MPRVLEIAIQNAISRRGGAVITIPGDVAMRDVIMTRVIAADPKETKRTS
jgi:thiamine pyrophosphate-dependent acetolactate synthase large subunit-like protein